MSFNKDLAKSNANGSVSLHEGENGFPFVTLQTAAGASAKVIDLTFHKNDPDV
jgi:hypothetical protein